MKPLSFLTFVRIGSASSHKYKPQKKLIREYKTLVARINTQLDLNIVEYLDSDSSLTPTEMERIDAWRREEEDTYKRVYYLNNLIDFSAESFHSPPQLRGIFAFPQNRIERFLCYWDSLNPNKFIHKDKWSNAKPKRYCTIHYKKPYLWCHHIHEAQTLGKAVLIKEEWVKVKSEDYLSILALYEKNKLKIQRKEMRSLIKHCHVYGMKDEFEVFLI
jgi:hypothetical protein